MLLPPCATPFSRCHADIFRRYAALRDADDILFTLTPPDIAIAHERCRRYAADADAAAAAPFCRCRCITLTRQRLLMRRRRRADAPLICRRDAVAATP
jgi:hypothetical protein